MNNIQNSIPALLPNNLRQTESIVTRLAQGTYGIAVGKQSEIYFVSPQRRSEGATEFKPGSYDTTIEQSIPIK